MNENNLAEARKSVEDQIDVNLVLIRNSLSLALSELNRAMSRFDDDAYAPIGNQLDAVLSAIEKVKRATCENRIYLIGLNTFPACKEEMEEEK